MTGVAKLLKKSIVFGGDNALREDLIKVTPKMMILWGILVLGSLLLLWMAFSLLKNQTGHTET